MTDAVAAWRAGTLSAEAALARLLLSGLSPSQVATLLPPGSGLARAFAQRRVELDRVAAMLAGVSHDRPATPQAIAAMFDAAVRAAPEASVAAYTLGDPALLAGATDEIVAWLLAGRLVFAGAAVLDLGCGIGRVAAALATHGAAVLGLDVSPGMVAEARRRHGQAPGLRFEVTGGETLDGEAASLDLILAVDSFPYLVQAGVADRHAEAASRRLRPGGALVVLNLSYDGDAADRVRLRTWRERYGLRAERQGLRAERHGNRLRAERQGLGAEQHSVRPFTRWDGTAFVLRRAETIATQVSPHSH